MAKGSLRTVKGITKHGYSSFLEFLFGEKPIKKGWSDNLNTLVFYMDSDIFKSEDEDRNEKRKNFAIHLESHFGIKIKTRKRCAGVDFVPTDSYLQSVSFDSHISVYMFKLPCLINIQKLTNFQQIPPTHADASHPRPE